MDIGSIFLILALMVLVILIIIRPFFEHKAVSVSVEEQEHSLLLAEQDRILDALMELDLDHSMGKIPEEDYPLQRAALLQKGSNILRRLEQFQGKKAARTTRKAHDKLEAWVSEAAAGEAVLAHSSQHDDPEDEIELLIASRRRSRQEKSAGFCPKCGGPLQKSDLFCPKCGERLK